MKYVIVGGVAGGATIAARLKRNDESAKIIIIERGEYISYANCGLPYYIGGTIESRDQLFVQTVEGFINRYDVDIYTRTEVESIDRETKTITVHNLDSNKKSTETYDKLILSPGAEPFRPPIEGINISSIFTLRNIPDTDKIKSYISTEKVKKAVIVGGGFIGLEMAENLHKQGIEIAIVEMAEQVMTNLDYSMASIVHSELRSKGVKLHLRETVTKFEAVNNKVMVTLKSGLVLASDMVVLSIGVKPETRLAVEAGLEIGTTGGIKVNEYLQTSDENIYALGDAIEINHLVTGQPSLIPLAGPANKQGRIAADNIIFGNKFKYSGSVGTGIAKVFDITVASAGASGKWLKKYGIDYIASFTHSNCHAGYYPDALPLSVKIMFSPLDGRLLGAQVVGYGGVDKRIDLFSQVIRQKGSVYDLMEIEHAYAPPFSSAKDPVNMAGFVADNILSGKVKIIQWKDILELNFEKDFLLDVRTNQEHRLGAIENSVNIPIDELRLRLDEIPAGKRIIIYCAVGLRGYLAYRILVQNGFQDIYNLSGGYKTYSFASLRFFNDKEIDSEK